MYASLKELQAAEMNDNYSKLNLHHRVTKSYRKGRAYRVTKSYRKGRAYRVQNIYDKNGFTVKQIIHHM